MSTFTRVSTISNISKYYTAQWAAALNDCAKGGTYDGNEIRKFREMTSYSIHTREKPQYELLKLILRGGR